MLLRWSDHLFTTVFTCYGSVPVSPAPLWLAPFKQAAAHGYRVAVCDTAGRLLACSNLEGHVVAGSPRLYGTGWWEFVHHDDLPAVLDYFRNGLSGQPISYRQLSQLNGRPVMADITIIKTWVGGAWLCHGAVRERRRRVRQRQPEHGG